MNREDALPANYTRVDLVIALFLAALVGAWLLAFAAILIKYGGHAG
jgi:hypothetical protein